MTTYYYFAFRVGPDGKYDIRLPDSGVVVTAHCEDEAFIHAIAEAERHLPCHPGEMIVLHPVRDAVRCAQAKLMQDSWQRAMDAFVALMEAMA